MKEFKPTAATRLFTFGCSFTSYMWMTWPQIIGRHYQIPLYNFGLSGAGNHYMFNKVMQADQLYNFTKDDIVMVCWTNVGREDRYAYGNWHVTGNIFSSLVYPKDWVKRWVDADGCAVRDFAMIKAVDTLLQSRNCQHQYFAMCDIAQQIDQWAETPTSVEWRVSNMFKSTLDKILPNFKDVLWQGDHLVKKKKDSDLFGLKFVDGHPTPGEHLEYLQAVTDIEFSTDVVNAVHDSQEKFVDYCLNNDATSVYAEHRPLVTITEIWPAQPEYTI
jgi:hypothetical protein